jgi:hypothetical protein
MKAIEPGDGLSNEIRAMRAVADIGAPGAAALVVECFL